MSNGTIIQQGSFTADGNAKTLVLRADVDWVEVDNYTVSAAGGAATGVEFKWQRGMADDTGFIYTKLAADDSITKGVMTSGGFTRIDTSSDPLTAINTTGTTITGATGVAAMTSTAGLVAGDVIRLVDPVGALQFGGVDFTIDTIVANTSVDLTYAPVIANSTTFSFYKVKWDPIFYPRSRYISSISKAAQAVVKLTVTHGYTVGQVVKFNVEADYGMTEIDGMEGTITAISTTNNTITVDIDTRTFTTFAWPLTTGVPFTHAKIIPVGAGSSMVAAGGFGDSKDNTAYIGMVLAAGTTSPAGAANDVIYWRAGKALDVNNE